MESKELKLVLFANLGAEMGRYGLTTHTMAQRAGVNYDSLRYMIAGRIDWKGSYMTAIQKYCFPNMTIDYLFKRFE